MHSDGFRVRVNTMKGLEPLPSLLSSQVCEGLFPAYHLPNGKQAFMYYNGGQLMDEVRDEICTLWSDISPFSILVDKGMGVGA